MFGILNVIYFIKVTLQSIQPIVFFNILLSFWQIAVEKFKCNSSNTMILQFV